MPSTDWDDEIIASMPVGTKVVHARTGRTAVVIGSDEPAYGQILVRYDDDATKCWCYPINLDRV